MEPSWSLGLARLLHRNKAPSTSVPWDQALCLQYLSLIEIRPFSFPNVPFLEPSVSSLSALGPEPCQRLLEAGPHRFHSLLSLCWHCAVLRGIPFPCLSHPPTLHPPPHQKSLGWLLVLLSLFSTLGIFMGTCFHLCFLPVPPPVTPSQSLETPEGSEGLGQCLAWAVRDLVPVGAAAILAQPHFSSVGSLGITRDVF